MVKQLSQLIELAKAKDSVTVAVAQAADKEVLEAVVNAQKEGIAKALLTGDVAKISAILTEMGENPSDFTIIQADSDEECAFKAVEQIRLGNANILMKGLLSTGTFMKAVINRDTGLRTGKTISHTMFYEAPSYGKLLCLTDGGMNTFPDLPKKADILENAIEVVKKLGIEKPTVACVCGAENVDPKVQSTLDADELSKMERFAILCGHYEGVDRRAVELLCDDEISIGDYVLTGGELAACVIADSVVRIIPGAIGDEASALTDCFQDDLLAPPVYTRPAEFRGWRVPDVLLSGNFAEIEKWQEEQSFERTKRLRPDLLERIK